MSKFVNEYPVPGFEMKFEWHGGDWLKLFDAQIAAVRRDVVRARVSDKLVVYLSCPISSRGGGYHLANVDIALATQRLLLERWGENTWILNPANYQMESRAGTGMMHMHAHALDIDLDKLIATEGMPSGGDYMRMWTKILVENDNVVGRAKVTDALKNSGQYFDAYYFLGPSDVHAFFKSGTESLTAAIEGYFARRMESDPDFRDRYSIAAQWGVTPADQSAVDARDAWRLRRADFLRFYMFRAGANYSLGCHDEWNIYRALNHLRRGVVGVGLSEQIAGFFDGHQISLSATEQAVSRGYETA